MTDTTSAFDAAVARSKTLTHRPDNLTLLNLYALYKQATSGDAAGERPGMTDFVGRAKWDAWSALKGQTAEQARAADIATVNALEEADG